MTGADRTVSGITEALHAARDAGRPVEVAGGRTVLDRLPTPPAGPPHDVVSAGTLTGITALEPADLVVTVRAGTTLRELDDALSAHGQECPIEPPAGRGSTVGGRVATGLTGIRRLGAGPVRDWLLGVRFVTGDGLAAHAGSVTVKNVTGYDLPRLLCGSWGTLAVLTEVTLRTRPLPHFRGWYRTAAPVAGWIGRLYRPAAVIGLPGETRVLLEGEPADCADQARAAGLTESDAPTIPTGARLTVPPGRLAGVLEQLDAGWAAEWGVGTVHLDLDRAAGGQGLERAASGQDPDGTAGSQLGALRTIAEDAGGRLLILRPDAGLPAFGRPGAEAAMDQRVKRHFDPDGVLAPWRFGL